MMHWLVPLFMFLAGLLVGAFVGSVIMAAGVVRLVVWAGKRSNTTPPTIGKVGTGAN